MTTPTHEQLQSRKEWIAARTGVHVDLINDADCENFEAYYQYRLNEVEPYNETPGNAELRRKVAALQQAVRQSATVNELLLKGKDSLQQQLTEANAEIDRLTYEGIKEWNCPTCGKCESFQVVHRHIKCKGGCGQEFSVDPKY